MQIQTPDPTTSSPLNSTQRRLEAVLANASVAILLMDHRQQCIYMNAAAEKLTGYTMSEILALDTPLHNIIHHTHPDGSPFPLEDCAIDRAFPEHNQVQGEETFVHKSGYFYPVGFTASPIRDDASQTVGTIIELRSILEEKQAQERQRLLMNELDHRVKNTLATVQSLAWQSFKGVDPEALGRFDGRLKTLANAHRILTEAAWQRASLREVIAVAIKPFGEARIVATGPDCDVHPKVAVSLSMVLHELVTNAIKYGALSVEAGMVSLEWSCHTVGNSTDLQINWHETGGPTVAEPAVRGFGSRLIERQFALEFGGTAELQFLPDGLVCGMHLTVPSNLDPLALPA